MRFTRLALRNRLQKVRLKQTSYLKNVFTFIKERKVKFFFGSSVVFGLYCLNKFYLRKYKGLNKISQRFTSQDSINPSIIKAELNYFNIFVNNNEYPWAIIFPKTLEEVQKIIKLAIKYGLSVQNENIDHLESLKPISNNPYIVINQKNLNNFVLNEEAQTITIGTGLTIKEINEKLIEKGFYLPIDYSQKNKRIFELINQDNAEIIQNNCNSISEIINSLNVVLPNSEALCTNIPIKKNGFGVSLNEIFIGSNSTLGIPIEATLKIFPIPKKVYKLTIQGDLKKVSSKIFDLVKDLKSILQENNDRLKQFNLKIENENFNVEIMSFSKINYDNFFYKYLSELEIKEKKLKISENSLKELFKECINHENKHKEEIFKYKFEENQLINLLTNSQNEYLPQIINLNKKNHFLFTFNLMNNMYALEMSENLNSLEKNEKFDEINKTILNYIVNRNGILINYYDKKKLNEFKSLSSLIEYGNNNLHLQKTLKKILDPKNLFVNDHYHHDILEK